jgi:hypothetical protein
MKKIVYGALAGLMLASGAGWVQAADVFGGKGGKLDVSDWGPIDSELTNRVQKAFSAQPSADAAKNVKVDSRNGKTTLSGTVSSQQDKDALVKEAEAVAGDGNVVDQLTVVR